MRKPLLFILFSAFSTVLCAQSQNAAYLSYIQRWKDVAVRNQKEYGIPASIIMAQALLESGAGQSELARKANNHFGIKCTSDWFGGQYRYADERRNDCFRRYSDASESFKDHAVFLQRPRYSTCFEIAVEDYEGWAHRLKQCGYATDPQYAPKLIRIIEDYRLDTLATGAAGGKPHEQAVNRESEPSGRKRPLKATVVHSTDPIMVIDNDPEPPYQPPLSAREERDHFFLMHPKKKCNGVTYVLAREGDTYANVAFKLNVRERELREDNDALGRELAVGDRIYLSAKKKHGEQDYIMTYPGLSLWKLCQEEGVQMESIQQLNELVPDIRVFRTRQKLYLRKVKDDGVR